MSLDQLLMLPPGYGFDSEGGGSPTVFTLVLDDLLTRHYPGTDQRFKLTATAGTTGFIEIDDNTTIYSASAMATDMQTKLRALTGYSGKVAVSGASAEAGDKYTFTITFDASLGAVTLDFHASSQWYPTITLTEAVTQQGVSPVSGVAAVYTFTCTGANSYDELGETITLSSGSVGFADTANTIGDLTTPSGWSVTAGGSGQNYVTWTKNDTGVATLEIVSQSSDGTYSLVEDVAGVDAVAGQVEIHTITPTPVVPTGGTWKPKGGGSSISFDASVGSIETQIDLGFSPGETSPCTVTGTLDFEIVTVTATVNGDLGDTALSPVNVSLTAPEITHSITPA